MKKLLSFACVAALTLPMVAADKNKDAKKKDASVDTITHEQADQILDELRQIRQLLEKQAEASAKAGGPAGPTRARLHMEGAPMLGSKDAPITVVEFSDYQCPFCQRFHTQVYGELKKDFIDTGKVRFYSRDLPIDQLHPNATRAAQAARCAGDQGQFWALRDIMSAHPEALDLNSLVADASTVKINPDTFRKCVETEKYKEAVKGDLLEAMKIGADGTPSFVVGKSTPDGVDGELIVGAQPYNVFQEKFKSLGVEK
jgi:protein-disulfide isomerase